MTKTKKIYRYENQLVDRCKWCDGSGWSRYLGHECDTCKGTGGKWKPVKILVGEEVTE